MSERREPTISSYTPTKEELARQQQARAKAAGGQRPGQPPSARTSAAAAPVGRTTVVKSKLAPVTLLFALAAGGVAGYSQWQLMQTQQLLADADVRIKDLEGKFELSDDEASASTETMQAKLKWADSEIRKLWGVSYDTNRKAIADNKTAAAQAAKLAGDAKKAVDAKLKGFTADLKLLSDLVDAQQATLASIEAENANVLRTSQSLTDKMNSLDNNAQEMERRIKTNEQAIEAIDAFRRNVNQQLLQLRGG